MNAKTNSSWYNVEKISKKISYNTESPLQKPFRNHTPSEAHPQVFIVLGESKGLDMDIPISMFYLKLIELQIVFLISKFWGTPCSLTH